MMQYAYKLWVGAVLLLLTSGLTLAQDAPSPVFSNPTNITNPYCPKSILQHSIAMGQEGGAALRVEETLLPMTRTIEWGGGTVDALVVYYIAFGDDQLLETAFDYFAQDDAGNLYYLGEEVTNYANGQIQNHNGSWLMGRDGAPPAILMPANLTIGSVWHSENRPGLVWEEDKVLSVSEAVTTPRGAITDGIRIQETLMDGKIEYKNWAHGFCEVTVAADGEQSQLVLTNYTTDEHRAIPDTLATIEGSAEGVFDATAKANWAGIATELQNILDAWAQYLAQNNDPLLPAAFVDAQTAAIQSVQDAVATKDAAAVRQAANAVSFAVTDLFTYYNPTLPTDLLRMDALERQVLIDLEAGDFVAATDTLAQTTAIWVRLRPLVQAQNNGIKVAQEFETSLNTQVAAVANNTAADAVQEATAGLELVDLMESVF